MPPHAMPRLFQQTCNGLGHQVGSSPAYHTSIPYKHHIIPYLPYSLHMETGKGIKEGLRTRSKAPFGRLRAGIRVKINPRGLSFNIFVQPSCVEHRGPFLVTCKQHRGRVDDAHQGQVLVLQLRGLVVASRGAVLHKADKVREHLLKILSRSRLSSLARAWTTQNSRFTACTVVAVAALRGQHRAG